MRLASQKLEELSSRSTDTVTVNMNVGFGVMTTPAGVTPVWYPKIGNDQVPEYVDAEGLFLRNSNGDPVVPQPGELGRYRWRRQWCVVNTGDWLPLVISVIVTYDNDTGTPKTVRLDLERRKSW